jgi:hypothetical protein
MADLVHPAMTGVLGKPPFLDGLELGAVAPIPVPQPDCGQAGTDGRQLPAHGVEMIAQLTQRVRRWGNRCHAHGPHAGGG